MNKTTFIYNKISNSFHSILNSLFFTRKHRLGFLTLFVLQTSFILFSFNCNSQSFDTSFCSTGYLPYGSIGNLQQNIGIGNNTVIQPDGKIVIAIDKSDPNSSDLDFNTYRYNADGTPDQSFGANGVFRYFIGTNSKNKDVLIEEDGKIVIVGESEYCVGSLCGPRQFVMMRLKPNGVLDSTFALNGVLQTIDNITNPGLYTLPLKVFKTSENKYIIAGSRSINNIGGYPFVARINYNGSYDTFFATNGIFTDTSWTKLKDMTMDANGNIYGLLEESHLGDTINKSDNKIFKINSSGVLDNSFGNGGRIVFSISNVDNPNSIAIRSDNKIVVAGTTDPIYDPWNYGGNIGYISIRNSNGSASSIYPQGFKTFKLQQDSATYFNKVIIADGDKMMICGKVADVITNFHEKALIYMFNSDGNTDNTFNGNGYMIFDYGIHSNIGSLNAFNDLDILPGGVVMATGYRNITNNQKKYLFLLKLKDVVASPGFINSIDFVTNVNFNPNPLTDIGYLEYQLEQRSTISIELIDMMGKTVFTFCENEKRDNGFHSECIHKPANCPRGIYFLVLHTSLGKITKKIVIN